MSKTEQENATKWIPKTTKKWAGHISPKQVDIEHGGVHAFTKFSGMFSPHLYTPIYVQPAMLFVRFKHGVFVAFLETNQSLRHHLPKLEETAIHYSSIFKTYIVYRKVSHPQPTMHLMFYTKTGR